MVAVIAKVTSACNSNCVYCDVVARREKNEVMSEAVVAAMLTRADEYLRGRPEGEIVEIIWHGGEPLLAPPSFYHRVAELQRELCPATAGRIQYSLQSNLTALTEAHLDALAGLGIRSLGTSYDPHGGIRGPGKSRRSDTYNQRFFNGARLLEQAGFGWGMIYVVTRLGLADPLGDFFFLTNLRPAGGVNFSPVLLYGERGRELAITPDEYVDYLAAIFPTWWANRERFGPVEPFTSIVGNLGGPSRSLGCGDAGECWRTHVNVAPDGAVSLCGRSDDWGLFRFGHIADTSFESIFADPGRQALVRRPRALAAKCDGCRFWSICHGGCPLDAWAAAGTFDDRTPWCALKSRFIAETVEPVTGLRFEEDGGHG